MLKEEIFMKRAIELAKNGTGFVSPNPLVGAVIVKNGKIIGEGWHQKFGATHAEINAIKDAKSHGKSTDGATLFVNLEPCCHHGKTPPCTDAIIKSGIKKVVIGMRDPNKKVNGKGIAQLKKAGIQIVENILETECKKLNEIFIHFVKTGLPFVALKAAMTKDGKIGIRGKEIKISDKESQQFAHKLRQKYDAILVGCHTVLTDNPKLNVRYGKNKRDPLRIILDPQMEIPKNAKVFNDKNYIVFTAKPAKSKNIVQLKLNKNGRFNLKDILKHLAKIGIASVLVEGGAKTFASFINQKIPQKAYFIVSPKVLPDKNAIQLFTDDIQKKFTVDCDECFKSGKDIIFEGKMEFN